VLIKVKIIIFIITYGTILVQNKYLNLRHMNISTLDICVRDICELKFVGQTF